VIDAKTGDSSDQPAFRGANVGGSYTVPPQIGLLHDIFRLGTGAQHSIGNAKEPRPIALEGQRRVIHAVKTAQDAYL
jgi:hypothetical protein